MAKKENYREYLKKEFTELIDALELPDLQKRFMKARCLEQLLWLESRAERARKWLTRLRLMTIIGSVLIPALVSMNFRDNQFGVYVGWSAFGLSQMVAISAAMEEYFHFGDKHAQYRGTAEALKSEIWTFLQLGGCYQECVTHAQGYSTFAFRVEQSIQKDVQSFMELTKQNLKQEKQVQEQQEQYFSSLSEPKGPQGTPNGEHIGLDR